MLLARTLYRQPRVLFLDEAFDQRDMALERRISTGLALDRMMSLVIVSHRPETASAAAKRLELPPHPAVVVAQPA